MCCSATSRKRSIKTNLSFLFIKAHVSNNYCVLLTGVSRKRTSTDGGLIVPSLGTWNGQFPRDLRANSGSHDANGQRETSSCPTVPSLWTFVQSVSTVHF